MSLPSLLPGGVRIPAYHFSVDDVFDMIASAETDCAVADRPPFRFLLDLAQSHCTVTDLYVFLRGRQRDRSYSLHDVSSFACRQLARLDGLRFGPHGRDYALPPHAQSLLEQDRSLTELYRAISRFCDSSKLSRWVRLHEFSECYEIAPLFLERGVSALLLTDKPAVTYRLGGLHKAALIENGWTEENGLCFIRSHLRLERCQAEGLSVSEVCSQAAKIVDRCGFVVLFTHEVSLANPRVREMARACIESLANAGVRSC
jgi:hypothetical protein